VGGAGQGRTGPGGLRFPVPAFPDAYAAYRAKTKMLIPLVL
jgi:hypothetical protein